jgi:hypothetical protein
MLAPQSITDSGVLPDTTATDEARSSAQHLVPRRFNFEHITTEVLMLCDLLSVPFKHDIALLLFESDKISVIESVVAVLEQKWEEQKWKEIMVQVKTFWCTPVSPILLLLQYLLLLWLLSYLSAKVFLFMLLMACSFPIVFVLVKDRLVLERLEAIRALCKQGAKESLSFLGANGYVVKGHYCEYEDPFTSPWRIPQIDVSNSCSAKWYGYSCQHTPFTALTAGNYAPCEETRVVWAEFWSKMTTLCTHRTLYHYLPSRDREIGLVIVFILSFLAAIQKHLYFALPVYSMVVVYILYDVHLYTRQRMAKRHLVWKYERKFTPYNVRIRWEEVTCHSLSTSYRQYVHVVILMKPDTAPGEIDPDAFDRH